MRHFLYTFLFLLPLSVFANKTKVVFASDDWCPIYCAESKLGHGIISDLFKLSLKGTKFEPQFKTVGWARAIELGRKGDVHGIVGAAKHDAPDYIYTRTIPLVSEDCYFGSKKNDTWSFSGLNSLQGKKVGIINSYGYGDEADAFKVSPEGKKIMIEASGEDALEQNIKKTLAGRLDYLLENKLVIGYKTLSNSDYKKLRNQGCNKAQELYIGFSPKKAESKELVEIFDKFLESEKGKSASKELLKKYTL